VLLLAATAPTLDGAEQMAGALQRQGLFYVVGVLAAVVVVLFSALVMSWRARLTDAQRLLRESLEVIQDNTIETARFTRALETRLPKLKLPPKEPPTP
jgi:hypothetical protein